MSTVSFVPQAAALDRRVTSVMLRVLTFLGGEGARLGYWSHHTPESLACALGISPSRAREALRMLLDFAYIEQVEARLLLTTKFETHYRVRLVDVPKFTPEAPISASRIERVAVPV